MFSIGSMFELQVLEIECWFWGMESARISRCGEGSCRHSSMTTAWCCMTWPAPAASTPTHSTRTGTPPSCRMYSRHNTNCPLHLRRPLDVRNDRDSRLRPPPSAFHEANPHRCHCQVINYFFEINLIESIANPATFQFFKLLNFFCMY